MIAVPKSYNKIPDNWLKREIFSLIKYLPKLDKFELYYKQGERTCICKFVKGYETERTSRLSGYFSETISCNSHRRIFGDIIHCSTSEVDECKKLSNRSEFDDFVISDTQIARLGMNYPNADKTEVEDSAKPNGYGASGASTNNGIMHATTLFLYNFYVMS
jgi:hypothetical protein